MDNYDEFGNYIGPDIEDRESSDDEAWLGDLSTTAALQRAAEKQVASLVESEAAADVEMGVTGGVEGEADRQVVPHEFKELYPSAEEVFGDAEVFVQEEDTQPLAQPIIAPVITKNFDVLEKTLPETTFSFDFLAALMYQPQLTRLVCFIGHLHHGKSALADVFIAATHNRYDYTGKNRMYLDTRDDEKSRGLSVKALPISLVLPDPRDKSHLVNIFDTPGHLNFADEVTAAIRLSDAAIIVVDALEGVMAQTRRLIQHALEEGLDLCLVVNCVDRLALELRLPPADAFTKLRLVIQEVNMVIEECGRVFGTETPKLSPTRGNVAFASAKNYMFFTLKSFARMYQQNMKEQGDMIDVDEFPKFLWGDIYHNPETRKFQRTSPSADAQKSFVQFVLEPLWKLFAHVVGEERPTLEPTLQELGVYLRKDDFKLDTHCLMKRVGSTLFSDACASFTEMVMDHTRSPLDAAKRKTEMIYTGDQTGEAAMDMKELNTRGTLVVHTSKNYHRPDCARFDVFGRVLSGTLAKGSRVKILGEHYSLDDEEDCRVREVENIWIYNGRYRVEVSHAPAGSWVLLGGVDQGVVKTSTITSVGSDKEVEICRPLRFPTSSVMQVSCEPLNPSELPKMLDGLRKIDMAYPLASIKVEDSGEHVICGTGELYIDCLLHDIRKLYGDIEIKVADPVVQFQETVVETSALRCFATTPNQLSTLHMVAGPLEKNVAQDIDSGLLSLHKKDKRAVAEIFSTKYQWDALAARRIWAFGPDMGMMEGPNVLVDDTLPGEVDRSRLADCQEMVVQGFQWATREGPLIEENMRNTKFKLLNAELAMEPIHRGGGQMVPTARRCTYSAFLLATPRLMEPVYFAEIICPADCVAAVYAVLSRRRGHVASDQPKPGTPLFIVHAYLPAMESFGFETDVRTHTSGQAMVFSTFAHWDLVPGDPLERSIVLRPLEPAPAPHLAREFLLKTRRRKGLSEDVSAHKFFDEPMLREIATQEPDISAFF